MKDVDLFHDKNEGYDDIDDALLIALASLPQQSTPPGFVWRATRRFEKAYSLKQQRRYAAITAVVFAMASIACWTLLLNIAGTRDAFFSRLVEGVAVVEVLMKTWNVIPVLTSFFGVLLGLVLVFFNGLIGKLNELPVRVK